MARLSTLLSGAAIVLAASAMIGAPAFADDLSMTIYGDGRALVEDSRDIRFSSGTQLIELPGVSSQIQAETATFVSDGLSINEQNFDFDLLSPEKLMEKAVGTYVEIVRTNPGTGRETREDYVAVFSEDDGQMDLQGWATLTNGTKTTFKDANVAVIAGSVGNQNNNFNQYGRGINPRQMMGNVRNAGTEASPQERVGDNYLYPLPGKITVKSNQTKQVGIVDAQGVSAAKVYEYRANGYQNTGNPRSADVRIAFANSRAGGLGTALPQGIFRVYTKDRQGRSQFIGEDRIGHIPGGSDMSLKIGDAFDVKVQGTVANRRDLSKKVSETEMVYEVTNATDKDTVVYLRQSLAGYYTETEMLSESIQGERENAYSYLWKVPVKAESETKLTFKVREKRRW